MLVKMPLMGVGLVPGMGSWGWFEGLVFSSDGIFNSILEQHLFQGARTHILVSSYADNHNLTVVSPCLDCHLKIIQESLLRGKVTTIFSEVC